MSAGRTLDEYQRLALATASDQSGRDLLITSALGLAGESGEFADHVKKWLAQGHDLDAEVLAKEVGDVLWYCALAARALGLRLSSIAEGNIEKLRRRYGEGGFTAERSRSRDD